MKLYCTACLLLYFFIADAQTIKTSGSQLTSVDYNRLANIDTLVNGYVNRNWVKGVVTIVVKDAQVVQYKSYGYSNAETKKPMENNSIFRIASQTKAIVSAGVLILYDEGRLALNDPVSKYIPEFAHENVLDSFHAADTTYTTVAAKRDITIKDLLTHTSGLDYPGIGSDKMKAIYAKANIPSGLGVADQNLLGVMKRLAKLPLAHQPGEKWTYGLSVDLLGCIIEVISGKSLEDFLHTNIFEPLGMNDTYFNLPKEKFDRLTTAYTEDSLNHIISWNKDDLKIDADYPKVKKHYFSGGAGLSSTAFDYAVFSQMIMNGGTYNGKTILSKRTVEMMLHPQLDFLFNGKNNFGLGFEIVTDKGSADGSRNAGSFDWGGYFGTTYWADPKEHLICLIMTQQIPNSHYELSQKFEQLVYAGINKSMGKGRLEAFSDGVIAIIITIMVLELKVPEGTNWQALHTVTPVLLSYVLSFVFIGIYWNNHHHLLQVVKKVSAGIMWANLNLLFWLSLVPVATGWMGENNFQTAPVALYAVLLDCCGLSYTILQLAIERYHRNDERLNRIMQRQKGKGISSLVLYTAAIPLAYIHPYLSCAIFVIVAIIWLIPDKRIEEMQSAE